MTRLLIDGIFFQLNNTGIARVWQSIIPDLARSPGLDVMLLDRGRSPCIDGVTTIPFPSYRPSDRAADSRLIQQICDQFEVDLFTSTYYTTPTRTPMVLVVYDMIPELLEFDMRHRDWMEKETAIAFAQRYVCISNNTRDDLLSYYPEIPEEHVRVAYCGIDTEIFKSRNHDEIAVFRADYDLDRPYFLFVGSRVQNMGYKNSKLFFDALYGMVKADFDVLCVGGERQLETDIMARLPSGVRMKRVDLSDHHLSCAYAGAEALVYPSLYEGFGMPVIEAMACECPVITTAHGSLAEAAGDAACLISGTSVEEMRAALHQIRVPAYRQELKVAGLARSGNFRWKTMVDTIAAQLQAIEQEARAGVYDRFFSEWRRVREIQQAVDF